MRKLLFLLPVILLLFNQRDNDLLIAPIEYGRAYADTVRIYPDTLKTGWLVGRNATSKATSRNKTKADGSVVLASITAGVDYGSTSSNMYSTVRGFLAIPIPALTSKPTSAVLRLYGHVNRSNYDTLFNIFGASAARSGGLTTEDIDMFDGWNDSIPAPEAYTGTKLADDWNSTSYTNGVNVFTLNSAGLDSVFAAQGDTLFLMIANLRDYFNTWVDRAEADTSTLGFKTAKQAEKTAGTAAHLWIDYTPAVASDDGAGGLIGGDVSGGRKW